MSDALKLLTPEEMDEISATALTECGCLACRSYATVIALAERLARVDGLQWCKTCRGIGAGDIGDQGDYDPCPDCDGTRKAFKDWQDALRSLGEG